MIQSAGQLYQQYIVDIYTKIKQNLLNYLRQNQSMLRTEYYQEAMDAICAGNSASNIRHHIILPLLSFSGGSWQMYQLYQDAVAIVCYFGKPNLFITFTCNSKWPEITRELLPYQIAADMPDLTASFSHKIAKNDKRSFVKNIGLEKLLHIFM